MMKKATRRMVNGARAARSGEASSMMPTTTPSTPEINAHQKPGAARIQKVVTSPIAPLTRNTQPRMMVTAMVASGGMMMAAAPSIRSTMPSIK